MRQVARPRGIGLGEAEIDVIVVGQDPQFAVARIDRILDVRAAPRDQHRRRLDIVGGDEAGLVGAVLAGLDEDEAPVLGAADADAEGDILGLLVERPVLRDRLAEPVQAGAVAAPILVDLGEDDGAAVGGPDRLADADLGHRLDVAAGGDLADAQLEALRAVVVDQDRGVAAVGADLHRAEPEILLARGRGGLVEDDLLRCPPPATGRRYQVRYCAPGWNAHQ